MYLHAEISETCIGQVLSSSHAQIVRTHTLLLVYRFIILPRISRTLLAALPELLDRHPSLTVQWQTGAAYHRSLCESAALSSLQPSERCRVQLTPFVEDMGAAYGAATLVVSRAGAIACSELAATGTPALLIPSPNVAEDHQTKNAEAMAALGTYI